MKIPKPQTPKPKTPTLTPGVRHVLGGAGRSTLNPKPYILNPTPNTHTHTHTHTLTLTLTHSHTPTHTLTHSHTRQGSTTPWGR